MWSSARRVLAIGLVSLAAFLSALLLHLTVFSQEAGSFSVALRMAGADAANRSYGSLAVAEPLPYLLKFDHARAEFWQHAFGMCAGGCRTAVMLSTYLVRPVLTIPLVGIRIPLLVILAVTAWVFARTVKRVGRNAGCAEMPLRDALILVLPFALMCALVWPVLALNHVLVHTHLDMIVFYLPFMLIVYLVAGLAVSERLAGIVSTT